MFKKNPTGFNIGGLAIIFFIGVLIPVTGFGGKTPVGKDTNKDGLIDQRVFYDDRGRIQRVETDTNYDQIMDRFRYYKDEVLIRIERDDDYDQLINCLDYFTKGKRNRQEKIDKNKKVYQLTLFNEKEQPFLMKKDTSGSGYFDSMYYFKDSALVSATRDPDENSTLNVWQTYAGNKPVEQKTDMDEDGKIEKIILYDSEGLPASSRHDLDGDGYLEALRLYTKGELTRQEKDVNQDKKTDSITNFKNGMPTDQKEDSNFDGAFDVFTRFKDGLLYKIEEDSRFTGYINRIRDFEKGVPVKVTYDSDGDEIFDTVSLYKNGSLFLQTRDKNKDNKPDIKIFFNADEEKVRTESDTDLNGKTDTWEYFKNSLIVRMEKDNDQNGTVDLKVYYKQGEKERLIKDCDENGYFEISQWFNDPKWSMVMEQDINQNRKVESRFY